MYEFYCPPNHRGLVNVMMIGFRNWKHRQQITAHYDIPGSSSDIRPFPGIHPPGGCIPHGRCCSHPAQYWQSPVAQKTKAILLSALQNCYFCPSRIGMLLLDSKVQHVLQGFKISVNTLKGFHFNEEVLKNQLLNKAFTNYDVCSCR